MSYKKILAIMAVLLAIQPTKAQFSHHTWSGNFNVRGNSLLLPISGYILPTLIDGFYQDFSTYNLYSTYNRWFVPTMEFDLHIPNWRIDNANMRGADWWKCLLFGDFSHNYNLSLGYNLRWKSQDLPVGAHLGLNYEWRGVCITEGALQGQHKTSGLVPAIGINCRVLGLEFEREHGWNIVVGAGVSYVFNLTYNNPCGIGKNGLNNGPRGTLSLGFAHNSACWSLRYEWDAFDYFKMNGFNSYIQNLVISIGMML